MVCSEAVQAEPAAITKAKNEAQALEERIDELNEILGAAVEDYNYAQVQLGETKQKLDEAQEIVDDASSAADAARHALNTRTAAAYQGTTGTALDMLLGSHDFSDFADRLEFPKDPRHGGDHRSWSST